MKFLTTKKAILLGVLFFCIIFILSQNDAFQKQTTYSTDRNSTTSKSLIGSQKINQAFRAEKNSLKQIGLKISNINASSSTGKLYVEIYDANDKLIASSEKNAVNLLYGQPTYFDINASLSKGDTYTLTARSENLVNSNGCTMQVYHTDVYTYFTYRNLLLMLFFLLFTAILILLPVEQIETAVKTRRKKCPALNPLLSRIFFFASPLAAYWIVEKFYNYPLGKFLSGLFSIRGALNVFIYGLICYLLYLLINRTKYASIVMCLIGFSFGLINYYLSGARGCPLVVTDFNSIKIALTVAGGYPLTFNLSALWAIVYTTIFLCLVINLKAYKGLSWKNRVVLAVIWLGCGCLFNYTFFKSTILKDHDIKVSMWNPAKNYRKNGSALSFVVTVSSSIIEKPSDYSADKVEKLAKQYPSDKAVASDYSLSKPNVIVIMNEALADLKVNKDFEVSQDFMPFIRNLQEDTVKGNLYVSIFGGSTANTEFEFLTGNTLAFFPFRALPYNDQIKDKTPSLTYTLKEQGYMGNQAIHPYKPNGYNRDVVYPLFGFEEFITKEKFTDATYIRNHVSDQSDFEFIIKEYEKLKERSQSPFYAFNVTMQNHGGYSDPPDSAGTEIAINDPALQDDEAKLYLNLIKKSDDAYEELINYFKKVDQPTIIVTFGDHQPKVHDVFYESLLGKSLNQLTLEESVNMYKVPYFIWANYDIKEENLDMSANYLSSYLLKIMGADMTGYNKYLLDLQKKLPIISAVCYIGDDGKLHKPGENSQYSDLINQYQTVQYNNLFDKKHRVDSFFFLEK